MKKLIYLSALIIVFTACKKDSTLKHFNGNYTGTFRTVIGSSKSVSDAEITFIEKDFKVTKGAKLANGIFNVKDGKTVNFADRNLWTADFDWNLILNGDYTYEVKGDSLILSKVIISNPASNSVFVSYQYRLKHLN